ncbi:MAG: hypothetical protein R3Y13_03505 [bacterium]
MGKKIILIFLIGFCVTLIMFLSLVSEKKDIMIIGDSISIGKTNSEILINSYIDYFENEYQYEISNVDKTYTLNNLTIKNVYDFIIGNDSYYGDITIKQRINNSEIIFISLGIDELNNEANMKVYLYYMDKVIEEIKQIKNNQIYLIGLYSSKEAILNINNSLEKIAIKYKISYVDISVINEEKYHIQDTNILNENGQKYIKNQIISIYEKNNN